MNIRCKKCRMTLKGRKVKENGMTYCACKSVALDVCRGSDIFRIIGNEEDWEYA